MSKASIFAGVLCIAVLIGFPPLAVFTWRHVTKAGTPKRTNDTGTLTFDADDVTGLRETSEVKLKGQRIGRVTEIRLTELEPNQTSTPEKEKPAFTVTVKIDDEYRKSWSNPNLYSMGKLTSETVVSPMIILLIPKSDHDPVPKPDAGGNPRLDDDKKKATPTPTPADRGRLWLKKEPDMAERIADLSGPVNALVQKNGPIHQAIDEVKKTLADVDNMTLPSLDNTLLSLGQTSDHLKAMARAFEEETEKGEGAQPPPTVIRNIATDLREMCDELKDTSKNLDALTADLATANGAGRKGTGHVPKDLGGVNANLNAGDVGLRREIDVMLAKISKAVDDIDARTTKAVANIDARTTEAVDNIDTGVTNLKKGKVGWFLNLGGSKTPKPSFGPGLASSKAKDKRSTPSQTPGKHANSP
jgi:hypothetical protein